MSIYQYTANNSANEAENAAEEAEKGMIQQMIESVDMYGTSHHRLSNQKGQTV